MIVPAAGDKCADELWDLEGQCLLTLDEAKLHQDLVARGGISEFTPDWLTVSWDGTRMAWLSPDRKIYVWDLEKPTSPPHVMQPEAEGAARTPRRIGDALILSLDGELVALIGHSPGAKEVNAVVRIWDVSSAKQRCTIRQEVTGVGGRWPFLFYMSFSPSGAELVTLPFRKPFEQPSDGAAAVVWDTRTGRQLRRWPLRNADEVRDFMASRDVLCAAYLSHQQFWRLGGQRTTPRALKCCPRLATYFVMSDNAFFVVMAGRPDVWETASQRPIDDILADGCSVPIAFSPSGRYLLGSSGGADDGMDTLLWDLAPRSSRAGQACRDLSALVGELRSSDAGRAQQAVGRLIAVGDGALREFDIVGPRVARAELIRKLIGQLDHEQFQVREAASRQLADIGFAAKAALDDAARDSPSAEVRRRAKRVLVAIGHKGQTADVLFELRGVQVLAGIGSDAARDQLQRLATTSRDERVAALARLSLTRLRSGSK